MKIILNNQNFWNWIKGIYTKEENGINQYIDIIKNNLIDSEFIVKRIYNYPQTDYSEIMRKLKQCIPKEYFLEIQYCISVYSSILGKLFPHLLNHIDQIAYIEWLLYMEPSNIDYRDHVVHMFKAAYLGAQILANNKILEIITNCQFKSEHFNDWCKKHNIDINQFNNDKRQDIIRMAFLLSALFHDFGYGYHFLEKYSHGLFKLYKWIKPRESPINIHSPVNNIKISLIWQFIKRYHLWLNKKAKIDKENNIINEFFCDNIINGFFYDNISLNHYVASALFVLYLIDDLYQLKAINKSLYIAFQIAAEACLIHDMTGKDNWAHLMYKKNNHFLDQNSYEHIPIAILLIFVDELAIWDRYKLKISHPSKDELCLKLDKNERIKQLSLNISDNQRINIKTDPSNKSIELEKELKKLKCLLNYNNKFEIFGYEINFL